MDITTHSTDENVLCGSCFTKVEHDDQFCNNCGYPLKGTEQEQKQFLPTSEATHIDLKEYRRKLTNATNTLYWLSGIFVLSGVIAFFTTKDDPAVLSYVLPDIILAIIFLALGGYTHKKPLACIISGFSLYIIVQILNAIYDPRTIVSGIYIKIVIIGFLIKGIKSAVEVDRIKKENNLA